MSGPRGIANVTYGLQAITGATAQTFESVDLGVWARQFLAAVDLYLSPQYAVPLTQLPGPTGPAGLDAINTLIQAKETLAERIAAGVDEILAGPTGPMSLGDAREAVKQRALVSLVDGFATNAVIWSPFSVTGPTAWAQPPNLSGSAVSVDGTGPGSTGPAGVYSLSTAKVPLSATAAASFLLDVQSVAEHKNLTLNLDYVANELEHNIATVPGITGYKSSSWLTFILPDGPTASPRTSSDVHLDTTIGALDVPVPLRAYPVPPTMVAQGATATHPTLSGTPEQQLRRAKLWDYSFSYMAQSAEQDTDYLTVAFNERVDPNARMAALTNRDLFDWLAQFKSVYPQIKRALAGVPAGGGGTAALKAISVMAKLSRNIAATWRTYPASGPSRVLPPGMTADLYGYRLDTTRDQTTQTLDQLSVLRLQTAPVDIGWPDVYVVGPSGSTELPVVSTSGDKQVYQYPQGITASAPLTQSFRFSGLDVIKLTSAWAGVAVTRNEFLLGPQGPTTNPGFIYRTPLVRFISTQVPTLQWNQAISIPGVVGITGPTGLPNFISPLLQTVYEWDQGSRRAWATKLAARYGYELNAGLQSFVPISLRPAFVLSPSQAGPHGSFVSTLSAGLTGWAAHNAPSATGGTFSLNLSAFAPGLTGAQGVTGARPVLELGNLSLPLGVVSGITGGAGQ